jgi:DNA-binding beta-propeller fold protein YncE
LGIAITATGTVYVADTSNYNIQYFTLNGSYRGGWGSKGFGPGEFAGLAALAVAPDGTVFATDTLAHRVQYFTSTGSFLGMWGEKGWHGGQFNTPSGVGVSPSGTFVYVTDKFNARVQWFTRLTNLAPASLGRVKALYR